MQEVVTGYGLIEGAARGGGGGGVCLCGVTM